MIFIEKEERPTNFDLSLTSCQLLAIFKCQKWKFNFPHLFSLSSPDDWLNIELDLIKIFFCLEIWIKTENGIICEIIDFHRTNDCNKKFVMYQIEDFTIASGTWILQKIFHRVSKSVMKYSKNWLCKLNKFSC